MNLVFTPLFAGTPRALPSAVAFKSICIWRRLWSVSPSKLSWRCFVFSRNLSPTCTATPRPARWTSRSSVPTTSSFSPHLTTAGAYTPTSSNASAAATPAASAWPACASASPSWADAWKWTRVLPEPAFAPPSPPANAIPPTPRPRTSPSLQISPWLLVACVKPALCCSALIPVAHRLRARVFSWVCLCTGIPRAEHSLFSSHLGFSALSVSSVVNTRLANAASARFESDGPQAKSQCCLHSTGRYFPFCYSEISLAVGFAGSPGDYLATSCVVDEVVPRGR
jgi:hypothetical protein